MRLKKWLSRGLLAVFVYLAYWFFSTHLEELSSLLDVHWGYVATLFVLAYVIIAVRGVLLKHVMRHFGILLSFSEHVGLTLANSFGNMLTGSFISGIGLRTYYLKKKYDLAYTKGVTAMVTIMVSTFIVLNILGLGILVGFWVLGSAVDPYLMLIMACGAVLSLIVIWLPKSRRTFQGVARFVMRPLQYWNKMKSDKRMVYRLFYANLWLIFFLGIKIVLLYAALGQPISLWQGIIIAIFLRFINLVQITPLNLGVQELVFGVVGSLLGFDFALSIIAASLDRIILTVFLVVTTPPYLRFLMKRMKQK